MTEARGGDQKLADLHGQVLAEIDALSALAGGGEPFVEAETEASGWTVLDHVEHLARAGEASLHQLEAALERDGGPPIRLAGRLVLLLGWIPRGVGKAPEPSRPVSSGRDTVLELLGSLRRRIEALGARLDAVASSPGRATHPIFGGLSAAQWLRFLAIHHHHHMKIIDAIRRAHGKSSAR